MQEAELVETEEEISSPSGDAVGRRRHYWLALGLAAGGGIVVLGVVVYQSVLLGFGLQQILLVLAGLLAIAGAALFFRQQDADEVASANERANLDLLREALTDDMAGLEKRRKDFEGRLMTYNEWLEFPDPDTISLDNTEAVEEELPAEVRERDRKVLEAINRTTEKVLEGVRADAYSKDGKFAPELILADGIVFIEEIARLYRPDSDSPLLETTPELLLKAINRISLQLLFQIEQLPLGAKDYNLAKVYDNAKKASSLFGAYKNLEPYLPIASYTWHLGRLVTASNPITAGTWFLGSEILRRGGQKVARQYIDRYTLKITGEAVRILGNEAAMLFDPGYRFREGSWIYGVELAELVSRFPLSRETLQHALDEVGGLALRSSYDRVFLYRCLAGHKSPKPEVFVQPELLAPGQRQRIARRLEAFFERHVHGRRPEPVMKWIQGVESRLNVALHIDGKTVPATHHEQVEGALRSLAGYLIDLKDVEPEAVIEPLSVTNTLADFDEEEREAILSSIAADPPMYFEYPDLEPSNPVLATFLDDLVAMELTSDEIGLRSCLAIREIAAYFRMPWEKPMARMVAAAAERLSGNLVEASPERIVPGHLVFAVPHVLDEDEVILFVYKAGVRELGIGGKESEGWVLGTGRRLFFYGVDTRADLGESDHARLLWIADISEEEFPVRAERKGEIIGDSLVLSGGHWLQPVGDENALPLIRLPGAKLSRFRKYFAPLIEFCGGSHEGGSLGEMDE